MISWLLATDADVPGGFGWLCDAEAARVRAARVPKRRAELRLGRFAMKRTLQAWLGGNLALDRLEVSSADDGAPEACLDGARISCALSLSHRDGVALCVVGEAGARLGCDLERVDPRAPSFAREWLSRHEHDALRTLPEFARDPWLTLLWSAKESALKALRCGLRRDPRDVCVIPGPSRGAGGWHPLWLHCAADPEAGFPDPLRLQGVWRCLGSYVVSVAASGFEPGSSSWITGPPLPKSGIVGVSLASAPRARGIPSRR